MWISEAFSRIASASSALIRPNDRRVVFLIEQIFGFGHGIGEAREVELVAHVFDHLPRLRGIARVGRRQDRFEFLVGDMAQRDRRAGEATQLGQYRQIGLFPIRDVDRLRAVRGVIATPNRRANVNGSRLGRVSVSDSRT